MFTVTTDPTLAKSWVVKIERVFDVMVVPRSKIALPYFLVRKKYIGLVEMSKYNNHFVIMWG